MGIQAEGSPGITGAQAEVRAGMCFVVLLLSTVSLYSSAVSVSRHLGYAYACLAAKTCFYILAVTIGLFSLLVGLIWHCYLFIVRIISFLC